MLKQDEEALAKLLSEVQASTKYRGVSQDLIKSIGSQELAKRRNLKEAIKATKNKLHQVSGAYLGGREDYHSWLVQLTAAIHTGQPELLRQTCRTIMGYHASTQERLPILDQFYRTLLADLPPPQSVLDIACGLNPLSIPWMSLAPNAHYYAYDIYQPMINFLDQYLALLPVQGQAQVCDVLQTCPTHEVDIALLFKAIPPLEQVDKQAGYRLLRQIKARYLIVSFPAHSLGGHSKGMATHYESHFRSLVADEEWQVEKHLFATELVFVVKKY